MKSRVISVVVYSSVLLLHQSSSYRDGIKISYIVCDSYHGRMDRHFKTTDNKEDRWPIQSPDTWGRKISPFNETVLDILAMRLRVLCF